MTVEDDISLLEQVPMLALLERPALRILAIGAESRYVHRGEVLFYAGEPADGGYVVQDGSFGLQAESGSQASREVTAGPRCLIGELALLTETLRPMTATALEPSTVIRISRSLFLKMLDGFPDAAVRLRDHIAERAEQTTRDMRAVRAALDAAERRR
ncbi:MAG TPA: Crp/Fnr family transcriptional regulator [Xanthobacteraceae bacterium]|nr:Crp/Fnr family transcriptional regulator [Xanthobacteraceae bacterium]